MQPEQQQRIMGYFIEEAKDHLNTIEQGLLDLKRTLDDPEIVNEMFRAAHSVKGGAAMLGLTSIQHVGHRLEDFFKVMSETSIQADQRVETLLLRVFDALQALIEQLQGPFGLTEDSANRILSDVEPLFSELEQHLALLKQEHAPLAATSAELELELEPVAEDVLFANPFEPGWKATFRSEVPGHLRNMLELFKGAETAHAREQLQQSCEQLAALGADSELANWCRLITVARQAIAIPDNAFRSLAPVVIREIKLAQDLVLSDQIDEVVPSGTLVDLAATAPAMAMPDSLADVLSIADLAESEDLGSDVPLEPMSDSLFVEMSGSPDNIDDLFDNFLEPSTAEHQGPEVGLTDLNTLADLFESELPDLDEVWQEEENGTISGEMPVTEPSPLEEDNDFSDLLFDATDVTTSSALDTTETGDEFSALFGDSLGEEDQLVSGGQESGTIIQPLDVSPEQPVGADTPDLDDLFGDFDLADVSQSSDTEAATLDSRQNVSLDDLNDLFAGVDALDLISEIPNLETTPDVAIAASGANSIAAPVAESAVTPDGLPDPWAELDQIEADSEAVEPGLSLADMDFSDFLAEEESPFDQLLSEENLPSELLSDQSVQDQFDFSELLDSSEASTPIESLDVFPQESSDASLTDLASGLWELPEQPSEEVVSPPELFEPSSLVEVLDTEQETGPVNLDEQLGLTDVTSDLWAEDAISLPEGPEHTPSFAEFESLLAAPEAANTADDLQLEDLDLGLPESSQNLADQPAEILESTDSSADWSEETPISTDESELLLPNESIDLSALENQLEDELLAQTLEPLLENQDTELIQPDDEFFDLVSDQLAPETGETLDTQEVTESPTSTFDMGQDLQDQPTGDTISLPEGALFEEETPESEQFLSADAIGDVDDAFNTLLAPEIEAASVESLAFADLEALLADSAETVPTTSSAESSHSQAETSVSGADFDELDALLKEAEETLGGSPSVKGARALGAQSRRSVRQGRVFSEQTMRVPVKHLDSLSNLVGELVVNRNSLEEDQERLRQSLDNLLYQVQQLGDVGQRMQDLYERSLLETSLLARRTDDHPGTAGLEYDPLEMDRFTGFHSLSQEMIELIVRVRESASDIEFVVDETEQVTRTFRQVTTQIQEGLNRSRMVPFAQIADRLPRAVRDISLKMGKQAELVIEGRDTLIDKMILEQLYDPMTHLVNNAITHGVESPALRRNAGKAPAGRILVRAFHQGNQTVISISDDGSGIDINRVKEKAIEKRLITPAEARNITRLDIYDLLFHPGFTTKDQADDFSGRGVGMDVVRTYLNEIRGTITTDSNPGKGTTFTIRLPLTLSISKALCCISDRARIAFPMDGVEDMLDVPREQIQTDAAGHSSFSWRDISLPIHPLSELLTYNRHMSRGNVYGGGQDENSVSIVVLRSAGNYLALQVDQVLGEQEIVIKQLEGPVPKPVGIAGATVLGDGRIMPIADVLELIDLSMGRIRRDAGSSLWEQGDDLGEAEGTVVKTEPTVLIVDDSITVRELLSMTFNKVGYRVEQARDGQEAWEKLRSGMPCDIVFCDIEMPRMDGLELLSRIQKDSHLNRIPIAMLTSRGADRHRQMATSLGAKGYFTKPYLEEALLDAAQRMLKGEVLINRA